jgi:hypothetical protein
MVVHMWMEFFGEYPPPRPGILIAIYLPYVILPIVAAARVRSSHPFSRSSGR